MVPKVGKIEEQSMSNIVDIFQIPLIKTKATRGVKGRNVLTMPHPSYDSVAPKYEIFT